MLQNLLYTFIPIIFTNYLYYHEIIHLIIILTDHYYALNII